MADVETRARTEQIELSSVGTESGSGDGIGSTELPAQLDAATAPQDPSSAIDALAPNGGLEAWVGVAASAMICFWYVGVTYSWGVLQSVLVERKLAPPSTLAFVGSLAVCLLSVFAVINSRLLRAIGARRMAFAGVILMGIGQILAGSCTHSIAGLFVTAGAVMGIGVSLVFLVVSIVPVQYFTTKRGTAIGTIYAGGGLGGAVISLAMEGMVRKVGIEWTFRLLGIMLLVCCLPAAWFIKERHAAQRNPFVDWSLFKDPSFLFLFAAGAMATFPLFVPPFFLPLYAESLHLDSSAGAILVCLFNFSSAAGRIMTGILSDRLTGPLNALLISLTLTAVTLLVLWPTSTSMAPLVVFVLLNGASNGAFFSIMPTVAANLLGSHRMGVAFGMIVTGWVGGYLMGAPLAGYILAAYGGSDRGAAAFRPAVFWAGGMAAGAAILVLVLRLKKSTQLLKRM